MAELHRHKFCAVSYSEKADVLAICNIAKNYLIDSFTKIVEDFIVLDDTDRTFKIGDKISLEFDVSKFSFFDIDTEERI